MKRIYNLIYFIFALCMTQFSYSQEPDKPAQSTPVRSGEQIEKNIQKLQADVRSIEDKVKKIGEKLDKQNKSIDDKLSQQNKSIDEKLDKQNKSIDDKLNQQNQVLSEKLNKILENQQKGVPEPVAKPDSVNASLQRFYKYNPVLGKKSQSVIIGDFDNKTPIGGFAQFYNQREKPTVFIGTYFKQLGCAKFFDTKDKPTLFIGATDEGTGMVGFLHNLRARSDLATGSVMSMGLSGENFEQSTTAYDPKVVGVVNIIYNSTYQQEEAHIALSGIVKVRVFGTIKVGDLLTTSAKQGVAMKVADNMREKITGKIIGKALENYDSTGEGLIRMLVMTR